MDAERRLFRRIVGGGTVDRIRPKRAPGTSPTAEKGPNVYSVPAIHRTLDIMEALIKLRTITVNEVNHQFKIPKSSAYAILQTLKARGYVHKDEQDRYSLSLKLFSLGSELIAGIDLRKSTYSLLKELADEKIEVMASIRLRNAAPALDGDSSCSLLLLRLHGPLFLSVSPRPPIGRMIPARLLCLQRMTRRLSGNRSVQSRNNRSAYETAGAYVYSYNVNPRVRQ
jgi:IclR helix-turn-helix domain